MSRYTPSIPITPSAPRVPTVDLPPIDPNATAPLAEKAQLRREVGEQRKQAAEAEQLEQLARQQLWRERRALAGRIVWALLKFGVLAPFALVAFIAKAAFANGPERTLARQVFRQGRVALAALAMAITALIAGCAPVASAPAVHEEPYQLRCHDARWMVRLENGDCFFWDQQEWSELIVCARETAEGRCK